MCEIFTFLQFKKRFNGTKLPVEVAETDEKHYESAQKYEVMDDKEYHYSDYDDAHYEEDQETQEETAAPQLPQAERMVAASKPAVVPVAGGPGAKLPRTAAASRFEIRPPFHIPQPLFSRPERVVVRSGWVTELQSFLGSIRGSQVSLVTASVEHQDVIVNWLVSASLVAEPPLENVLCLCLDAPLHWLLLGRGFSSLLVTAAEVINPMSEVTRTFSQVHIVRLTVLRLMTHYGYDVVNYDCDAILLKNPQILFDGHKDADIIGTFGKGPYNYFKKWGVTLNTGVMLIRSNPRVGECEWFT